jgi:hypothetical protein
MEQLVSLQGLCHCKFAVSLEIFNDCGELLSLLIFLSLCLAFWSLKELFQLLPNFNYGPRHFPNIVYCPLLLA